MPEVAKDWFSQRVRWICWLPLAILLGIEWSIRRFDGWGAWSTAPLLLVPAIVSVPLVILGLFECAKAARAREPILAAFTFTWISAVPMAWLAVRRFVL